MEYLPIFLRLQARRAIVVGGGHVAARKVDALLRAGARVTVVAPQLLPHLVQRASAGDLEYLAAEFAPDQLEGAALVVAATDDARVNAAVSHAAQARQIPVNVVDHPALSSFIFPAIIDRSPLVVAVSSAGGANSAAGSRFPCTALPGPSTVRTCESGERQSTPTTSTARRPRSTSTRRGKPWRGSP